MATKKTKEVVEVKKSWLEEARERANAKYNK